MVDRQLIGIEVTTEEREHIEKLAHQRGYEKVDEYLRALILSDEEAHAEFIEDFRQSWREAMSDNTRPLSELWDSLDDE